MVVLPSGSEVNAPIVDKVRTRNKNVYNLRTLSIDHKAG